MISNISLKEMGKKLFGAKSVLIFPHINPDGDALGASTALCMALKDAGVDAWVYSDKAPEYLEFLSEGTITMEPDKITDPEICIAVDCSDDGRLKGRLDVYRSGREMLCLDHHISREGYGDFYYIDSDAAATSELVYLILKETGVEITRNIANSIYTGLSTDTGNYRHSNTTPQVHRIAADLLELGVDHTDIIVKLYNSRSMTKVLCESRALAKAMIFADGKASISFLTGADMAELNATSEDADEIIDALRDIRGVEIAAYLEEREDGVKVSMRAKTYGNVADIAIRNGGGGHVKAAGCTINAPMEEVFALIKREIEEAL